MPTYEYHCDDCGRDFERVEHIEEHGSRKTVCPGCRGEKVRQVFTPFLAQTSKKS